MTVDGPEIGTLVLVVDRAKNLPNRKTIGKQDPYCAARLGKEAKKTTTDIRGGQTPKWQVDQPILSTSWTKLTGALRLQGPRAPIHRPRLAGLLPTQGVGIQRRQEDGIDWRGLDRSARHHCYRRRPERPMAPAGMQGQVRGRCPDRNHILRRPAQARKAGRQGKAVESSRRG